MILRRLTTAFRQPDWFTLTVCPRSAKSGLAVGRQPNDRTELTLPDAEVSHRSQLALSRVLLRVEASARKAQGT